MLIGFMGTGGTGKTTAAKALCAATGLPFIASTSRPVFEKWGITEADQRTMPVEKALALQQEIFARREELEETIKEGVADRTLLDQVTYNLLRAHSIIDQALLNSLIARAEKSLKKYDWLVYFPLWTFPHEPDMRDSADGSRYVFDATLRHLLRAVAGASAKMTVLPVLPVAERVQHLLTILRCRLGWAPPGPSKTVA